MPLHFIFIIIAAAAASSLFSGPAPSALQFHTCKFGFASDNEGTSVLGPKTKSRAFQMVVSATKNSNKEVTMVDPLEAKRLAEKQMQKIRAKEKYQRKREIEAVNGGWAMIGLTAGLVIESHAGNGILKQFAKTFQLVSHWDATVGFWFH